MPKIRLKYDGWLALPVTVRQKLGLQVGDQLDVALVHGGVVLRPAGRAEEAAPAEPMAAAEPAAPAAAPPVKRGPGRPRKVPAPVAALPPRLKTRGRRATAATTA